MKTTEVNTGIIGKRCKCIFHGLMVTGVIEKTNITAHVAEVKVRFDEPHQWGDYHYTQDWVHARPMDEFGTLQYLEIIDDTYQTRRVIFNKPIREIDRMFAQDHFRWGAVNLKEWIDSYESSRFTQIAEDTAIITSEYNMEHIEQWLRNSAHVQQIKKQV